MNQPSRVELVRDLRDRLHQIERGRQPVGEPFYTGTALDQLLPHKGLAWGTLIELVTDGEGNGAATLALALTASLLQRGGVFGVIASERAFYPPGAAGLGIALDQTVVVQPNNTREALWALEQSLRSNAVAVALGWSGSLNDRTFRRLQLAAERGGGLGFLLRPVACRAERSWADARLFVEALPTRDQSSGRRLHVELLHCRGVTGGGAVELELNDEAGHVRLASGFANSAHSPARAGA